MKTRRTTEENMWQKSILGGKLEGFLLQKIWGYVCGTGLDTKNKEPIGWDKPEKRRVEVPSAASKQENRKAKI